MADRLAAGRALRVLTLVDNVSRVSPAIEVGGSLNGQHVTEVLDRAAALYGLPAALCVDIIGALRAGMAPSSRERPWTPGRTVVG